MKPTATVLIMIVLGSAALVLTNYWISEMTGECQETGGTLVRTHFGFECLTP